MNFLKRKIYSKISLGVFFFFSLGVKIADAQRSDGFVPLLPSEDAYTLGLEGPSNLQGVVTAFFNNGLIIIGFLAVLMITFGGIQYMGGESVFSKDEGKKKIGAAIAGVILALGSWLILNTINSQITAGNVQILSTRLPDGGVTSIENSGVTTNPGQEINYNGPLSGDGGNGLGTIYYVINENDYSGPKNVPIRDGNGNVIAMVSQSYYNALDIEGSGQLADGRFVNIGSNRHQYGVVEAPQGNRGNNLEPFRSVAADQSIYPYGSLIYVPSTEGMALPGGGTHNGIWRVDDVGRAIDGNHIDFYVGGEDNQQFLRNAGVSGSNNIDFTVLGGND